MIRFLVTLLVVVVNIQFKYDSNISYIIKYNIYKVKLLLLCFMWKHLVMSHHTFRSLVCISIQSGSGCVMYWCHQDMHLIGEIN